MAKAAKTFCMSCEKRIGAGEPFCSHCAQPTPYATYDQRVEWEVSQWKLARASAVHVSTTTPPAPRRRARRAEPAKVPAMAAVASQPAGHLEEEQRPATTVAPKKAAAGPRPVVAPVPRKPAPKRVAERLRVVDAAPEATVSTNGSVPHDQPAETVPLRAVPSPKPAASKAAATPKAKPRKATIKTKPVLPRPEVDPSEFVIESERVDAPPPAAKKKAPAAKKKAPAAKKTAPARVVKLETAPAPVKPAEPSEDSTIDLRESAKPSTSELLEQTIELLLQMNERLASVEERLAALNGNGAAHGEATIVPTGSRRRLRLRRK